MKFSIRLRSFAILMTTAAATFAVSTPGFAQEETPQATSAEPAGDMIIVTARKRDETSLDVPVALTALGAADLSRYASNDFSGIANQVPGLMVVPTPGGAGGSIALRGVTSSAQNPAIDQAVSLNVDGVQVGSANFLRLSQIDLQQVEILKGPQALFFGKNSPGGVISIRTADPKDYFEGSLSLGYEFNAKEITAQAMISGPLAENLKGRLVVYGNKMDGYLKNQAIAIPGFSYAPDYKDTPDSKEIYVRGTLLFDPSDALNIRVKYGYSNRKASSPYNMQQRLVCPYGAAQTIGYPGFVECKPDNKFTNGGLDERTLAANPFLGGERGKTQQHLASLEANYEVAPDITFTSVTGFFKINDNFMGSASYQNGTPLIAGTIVSRREFSQEVRLATNRKEWPINFTIGAYFQDLGFKQRIPLAIDLFSQGRAAAPGLAWSPSDNRFLMDGKTYSAFAQAIVPFGKFELAGGARYTEESKSIAITTLTGPKVPLNDHVKYTNWSPEATITFKPNRDMTIFGAWRNGFKSGGFNTGGGSYATGQKIEYEPEDAQGFEAGLKAALGPVQFNLTGYTYKFKDMQVSTFDPSTLTQTVVNAASARIKGIEADVNYRTPLDGLTLRGSVNYNHARYIDFKVGCYTGQTIAAGCNIPVAGVNRQQDFAGRELYLAPDWTGNAGFTFEQPLGGNLRLTLTGDASFSSSFFGQLEEAPLGKQDSYAMFDASVRISDEDDRWEVALIGRNLSEVLRARFVSQVSFTGIASTTGTNTLGGLPDYSGILNRGREIRLQFRYNFR